MDILLVYLWYISMINSVGTLGLGSAAVRCWKIVEIETIDIEKETSVNIENCKYTM